MDAANRMPAAAAAAMGMGAGEHPEVVDVAIVGGGIGGLATALAFKRLTNLTCHVFERCVRALRARFGGWQMGLTR